MLDIMALPSACARIEACNHLLCKQDQLGRFSLDLGQASVLTSAFLHVYIIDRCLLDRRFLLSVRHVEGVYVWSVGVEAEGQLIS